MSGMDFFQQCDAQLLLFFNGWGGECADSFFWTVTKTATWVPLFLALFYIVLKREPLRRALFLFLLVGLVVAVADQVASGICKNYFQRPRPTHHPELESLVRVVRGYRGGPYGFFSSHASNTFAIAAFFATIFRRRAASVILFSWAALSSYSRLYLGVHYPSDIAVGLLFGLLVGWSLATVFNRYANRIQAPRAEQPDAVLPLAIAMSLSGVYILVKMVVDVW